MVKVNGNLHFKEVNRHSGTYIKVISEIALQKEFTTGILLKIIFSNTGKPSSAIHLTGQLFLVA
jgi:hypothetical protein